MGTLSIHIPNQLITHRHTHKQKHPLKKRLKARITRDAALFRGAFGQYDVYNELVHVPSMIERCDAFNTTLRDAFKCVVVVLFC